MMTKITNIPTHIAMIMDGNGRWATKNGFDRSYGHIMGVESVKIVIDESLNVGIKYLTLYAFSSENWNRPTKEVNHLMELFCSTIIDQIDSLMKMGVRVLFMGRISDLSDVVQEHILQCEKLTANNKNLTLNVALNYSSKNEIVDAVKKIAENVKLGTLDISEIDENTISTSLYTNGLPDPDFVIRTSGESRLSNFMMWQLSYSELYFTKVLWPDFGKDAFYKALEEYSLRQRRFGAL